MILCRSHRSLPPTTATHARLKLLSSKGRPFLWVVAALVFGSPVGVRVVVPLLALAPLLAEVRIEPVRPKPLRPAASHREREKESK